MDETKRPPDELPDDGRVLRRQILFARRRNRQTMDPRTEPSHFWSYVAFWALAALVATIIIVLMVKADPGSGNSPSDDPSLGGVHPVSPLVTFTDGVYAVGGPGGILPGAYSTDGRKDDDTTCSWMRLASPDAHSPLATGTTDNKKITVTIEEADGAFSSEGCLPWTRER